MSFLIRSDIIEVTDDKLEKKLKEVEKVEEDPNNATADNESLGYK